MSDESSRPVSNVSKLPIVMLYVRCGQDRDEIDGDWIRRNGIEHEPVLVLDPASGLLVVEDFVGGSGAVQIVN